MSGKLLILLATTAVLSAVAYRFKHRLVWLRALPEVPLHDGATDAERFAHLLTTEIRLYNVQEVESVALHGTDPSDELRAEIASSRELYRQRFSAPSDARHFENAVLNVLAGGNSRASAKLVGS